MARRSILTALAALALVFGALARGPLAAEDEKGDCKPGEKVAWQSYDQTIARARDENKPAVVVFYQDHCRQCDLLREKGFNRPDNACYTNRKLAAALVHGEQEPEIREKYRAAIAPTVWFVRPDGQKIDFFAGYVSPDRLALILRYVGEREYERISFGQYLKEREQD